MVRVPRGSASVRVTAGGVFGGSRHGAGVGVWGRGGSGPRGAQRLGWDGSAVVPDPACGSSPGARCVVRAATPQGERATVGR